MAGSEMERKMMDLKNFRFSAFSFVGNGEVFGVPVAGLQRKNKKNVGKGKKSSSKPARIKENSDLVKTKETEQK